MLVFSFGASYTENNYEKRKVHIMVITLPPIGAKPIPMPHFPTVHQAFIFRAYEYIPVKKIAALLKTSEENIMAAARDMGLGAPCESDIWLNKGYITIIKAMWHILPYAQLLELLEMDEETFAVILREEDFLDIKLGSKPDCEPVVWRELTAQEAAATEKLRAIVEPIDISGAPEFDFTYDVGEMKFSGKQYFDMRMVYGFSSLYLHALDEDSRTYCPDSMLESYRKVGVNAIWIQGVLFQLTKFPFAPHLSEGYEARLARLKDLTERCDKYGIKVYLYMNEPRSMPENFYEKYPHLKGHNAKDDKVCLCTSTKEVQDYLTNGIESICRAVPLIGGFFTITRSENPTNCYSHSSPETCTCPRCSQKTVGEVVGQTIACIERGAHKVNPAIKVIAWSWAWNEENLEIIEALPDNVVLQSQSELHVPYNIGGVKGEVVDYSMGIIGPGERAKKEWRAAKARGLETSAKVQINTTWEGSTIPAIPIYPHIEKHIREIRDEGVDNLMLSWTLGGYPSRNIMHAAKYFYEHCEGLEQTPEEEQAAAIFTEAFREFPFHIDVAYQGPQNAGPSNPLYLEPTGYDSTMTCFAYDDLKRWRADYPEDVFEDQFAKICDKWSKGLAILEKALGTPESNPCEMNIMAHSAYSLYKSCLNQIRFYRARARQDKDAMLQLAKEEITCAETMLSMMRLNSAVGFEAANHYYFSKGQLREKILNCYDIIARLEA